MVYRYGAKEPQIRGAIGFSFAFLFIAVGFSHRIEVMLLNL
jgi:hypothetical protein